MYKSSSSKVVPIVIVLIVVAIAIAAMVSVGRAIFGGNDSPSQSEIDLGQEALLNTSAERSVRMTVRGPIVANENFRTYQVSIDSSSRRLTTYRGYLNQTIDSLELDNNTEAYEEFVYALHYADLMKGASLEGEENTQTGRCADGQLYEFELLQSTRVVKRLWTTTCKGSPGSLRANIAQVRDLFLDQIPESKTALRTIDL